MQHLMHISLQNGFNFLVHPSAFVVHVPHPKPSTKWLTRKMGQVRGQRLAPCSGAAALLPGCCCCVRLVCCLQAACAPSCFAPFADCQRTDHRPSSPCLPSLAQKEKNHVLFDAALFHMRQMDFVPVTSFPQLCTKEVRGQLLQLGLV